MRPIHLSVLEKKCAPCRLDDNYLPNNAAATHPTHHSTTPSRHIIDHVPTPPPAHPISFMNSMHPHPGYVSAQHVTSAAKQLPPFLELQLRAHGLPELVLPRLMTRGALHHRRPPQYICICIRARPWSFQHHTHPALAITARPSLPERLDFDFVIQPGFAGPSNSSPNTPRTSTTRPPPAPQGPSAEPHC